MKKILSLLVFAICILSINFCSANRYDNDPDYVALWGRQGIYEYLYLPSVHVQEYNPPHYQIGFNTLSLSGENERWIYNCAKRYNWYTKESFHLENGYWVKDDVDPTHGLSGSYNRALANALFRAAYRMNFYGD